MGKIAVALSVLTAGVAIWVSLGKSSPNLDRCTDKSFFPVRAAQNSMAEVTRSSQYVTMSDGVKLAVDVYLPSGYSADDDPLPTFLHLTRYHRSEKRSWISRYISLFGDPPARSFPMRSLHYIKAFVPSGYAFVSADVRGTGASYGTRPVDLVEREVQDYAELSQWVHNQSFCNGRVGTGGISYDGIAGALMAAQGLIQAAVLLFAPGDLYEDIVAPGGVFCQGFIDMYSRFTAASERNMPVSDVDNELPWAFKIVSSWLLDGVYGVDGYHDQLEAAVAMHEHNFDMATTLRDPNIVCKDDPVVNTTEGSTTMAELGISKETYSGLTKHNVSVYSVAGYFDSGSIRSALRVHQSLPEGQSKLTIGPWTHGARACVTPTAPSTVSQYDLFYDTKRFMDCKLKDECTALPSSEPLLNYFLMGPDKWESIPDGAWPPKDGKWSVLHLHSTRKLVTSTEPASDTAPFVDWSLDLSATSGVVSRWNLVQHLMKRAVTYPDRAQQAKHCLAFTTAPLRSAAKIVGSVLLRLQLELTAPADDTVLFVYLEAVDPTSSAVTYITEGQLRVAHRTHGTEGAQHLANTVGSFDTVKRSFNRSNFRTLDAGQPVLVEVLLEPVAYQVPAGCAIRLSLAGADNDNFLLSNVPNLATSWRVHTNDQSSLWLPLH